MCSLTLDLMNLQKVAEFLSGSAPPALVTVAWLAWLGYWPPDAPGSQAFLV